MCTICSQVRPEDPRCPYEAADAALLAARLAQLDRLGFDIADAEVLLAGPVPVDRVADPDAGVGFPENDPTGFAPFFDIPGTFFTTVQLEVGARLNAEISFFGDADMFFMQLVAGQTYQISMSSLPFLGTGDPKLFLYDNFGRELTTDDNSGGGTDALLTITATRTGVYFVAATGFGGGGSTTGGYQIALSAVNFSADRVGDSNAQAGSVAVNGQVFGTIDFIGDVDRYAVQLEKGKSYYVVLESAALTFSPLSDPKVEIVDSRGNVIAFNDDNGITRNSFIAFDIDTSGTYYIRAQGGGVATGDFRLAIVELEPPPQPDLLSGVDWGVKFDKTTIRYYFADVGESVMEETTDSRWSDYEKQQAAAALNEFAKIAPLTFVQVTNRSNADFVIGKGFLDSSLSGKMAPQDPAFDDLRGQGWFNTNARFWSDEAGGLLEKGAYGYSNFVHEFGHGLGLAHPHDDGGGTSEIFPGVRSSGDFGELNMNQEVFTVMSYNKGWQTGPAGGSETNLFGIAKGPMALDIAVIQRKYGVNADFATGNDTYVLDAANGRGTGYEAIWDAGGRDTMRHNGPADARIDLRPATLKFEIGGGGFVSFVDGIFGGFTIANGVMIENGIGGRGDDTLVGNNGRNVLSGGKGSDTLVGFGGNDRLIGANGNDGLEGGNKNDVLLGGAGNDTLIGGTGNDRLTGGKGTDRMAGNAGNDTFVWTARGDFGRLDAPDTIDDFGRGADRVDVSALGLAFRGTREFSGAGDEVRFAAAGDNGRLLFDFDGDGSADAAILLRGVTTFDGAALLL